MHSDIEEEISETGEAEMTQRSSEAAVCVHVCAYGERSCFCVCIKAVLIYYVCI